MAPSPALWTIGLATAAVYGLCIGSFLNVVIYRLPRGESVGKPTWSYCPNCRHRLAAADLAPLVSFLALGRKCRYCRDPISWRYFGVELLTGILFTAVYLKDGWGGDAVFDCLFAALLVPIFFIDLEQFIIPDELSVLGFAVGVGHNIYRIGAGDPGQWTRILDTGYLAAGSLIAAAVCALIFHLISFFGLLYYSSSGGASGARTARAAGEFWVGVLDDYAYLALKFLGFGLWLAPARRFIAERDAAYLSAVAATEEALAIDDRGRPAGAAPPVATRTREEIATELENEEEQTGMGQGDAKLAAMIGANLLLPLSLVSFFLAVLAGTLIGVGMMIAKGRGGRMAIPFGPFLVVGAVASLLAGSALLQWYLGLVFPTR